MLLHILKRGNTGSIEGLRKQQFEAESQRSFRVSQQRRRRQTVYLKRVHQGHRDPGVREGFGEEGGKGRSQLLGFFC